MATSTAPTQVSDQHSFLPHGSMTESVVWILIHLNYSFSRPVLFCLTPVFSLQTAVMLQMSITAVLTVKTPAGGNFSSTGLIYKYMKLNSIEF